MTKTSITFLCDSDIIDKVQLKADKDFEGNLSVALRWILKEWGEKK